MARLKATTGKLGVGPPTPRCEMGRALGTEVFHGQVARSLPAPGLQRYPCQPNENTQRLVQQHTPKRHRFLRNISLTIGGRQRCTDNRCRNRGRPNAAPEPNPHSGTRPQRATPIRAADIKRTMSAHKFGCAPWRRLRDQTPHERLAPHLKRASLLLQPAHLLRWLFEAVLVAIVVRRRSGRSRR